jgi:hypothetical protein
LRDNAANLLLWAKTGGAADKQTVEYGAKLLILLQLIAQAGLADP